MAEPGELMSSVDHAWLRMDHDDNLMMICSVLVLEKAPDRDRLADIIRTRLLAYDRFSQRVVEQGDKAWWQDDGHFHLDNHLHYVGLPGAADEPALQAFASDLASTPLDHRHPLWTMHVIEQYRGGAAIIVRIHHCIADGLALVRVLLSLADDAADPAPAHAPAPPAAHQDSLLDRIWHPAQVLVRRATDIGHELFETALDVARHPEHGREMAERVVAMGKELVGIGLMPGDPHTALKGRLSGRKQVAWAEPLDLAEVKALAHAMGGTVNDVLLTVAASALRDYLDGRGESTSDAVHVAVPFNLRPLDRPIESLGNQFGLVIVGLPVHEGDHHGRFRAVQRQMQALKVSAQPLVFYGMLSALGRGPEVLERTALDILSKKASLVMTNVPGPPEPLYLAGARVLQPLVWVPQSGEVGVGLSILSYAGTVQFGVIADQALVPVPAELAALYGSAFQALRDACGEGLSAGR
jgi:WS/DGAT/MGAT family acyltransferase